jgi:hypothetical protein
VHQHRPRRFISAGKQSGAFAHPREAGVTRAASASQVLSEIGRGSRHAIGKQPNAIHASNEDP